MENNNMTTDLEQMRQQMETLKTKLDEQQIINDKLLKQSMKSKMNWIRNYILIELFAMLPFIGIACASMQGDLHFSWWSYSALMLLILVDVLLDYRVNVTALKESDYEKDNLVETVKKLAKMKHQRWLQTVIGLPLGLLILGWMGTEIYLHASHTAENNMFLTVMLISCSIGFCIGIAIGLTILHKMQKTNDELISQMKEITQEP
jgi:hypothetical protein